MVWMGSPVILDHLAEEVSLGREGRGGVVLFQSLSSDNGILTHGISSYSRSSGRRRKPMIG